MKIYFRVWWDKSAAVRRLVVLLIVGLSLLSTTERLRAGNEICKVLPQFLDLKGRASLAPSLYERDAYQFYLRKHPEQQSALRLVVQWKARGLDWPHSRLQVEMRGLSNNAVTPVSMEEPIHKSGFFGAWSNFDLKNPAYKQFGDLVAWRVTLWESNQVRAQLESSLWSGVPVAPATLSSRPTEP